MEDAKESSTFAAREPPEATQVDPPRQRRKRGPPVAAGEGPARPVATGGGLPLAAGAGAQASGDGPGSSARVARASTAKELRPGVLERFWARVNVHPDGCWLWTGGIKGGTGYGSFDGESVHRVAYELLRGPIPRGLEIDHLCRVRRCVNPGHLEPVTHRENGLRGVGVAAKHARKTHCLHGHEFTEANTYRRPDRPWWRGCQTCIQERNRQRYRP